MAAERPSTGRQRDFSRSMTRDLDAALGIHADEDVLGEETVVLDAMGMHVAKQVGDGLAA
jgi:hypothetical protein